MPTATPAQSGPTQSTAAAAHSLAANLVVAIVESLHSANPHISIPVAAVAAAIPLTGTLIHWVIIRFGMSQYVIEEEQLDQHAAPPTPAAPLSPLPEPHPSS